MYLGIAILFLITTNVVFLVKLYTNKKRICALTESLKDHEKLNTILEHNSDKLRNEYEERNHLFNTTLHTVKTQVQIIMGFNEQFAKDVSDPKLIQHSRNHVENVRSILTESLDLQKHRSEKATLSPLDFTAITESCLQSYLPLGRQRSINIQLTNNSNQKQFIIANLEIMEKILQNLMSNALKYTQDGGKIELILDCTEKYSTLSIKDNGIGIAETNLENLLQPFTKSQNAQNKKETGNGLGLYITKTLMESVGGNIEINSSPGKGCTVCLNFPIYDHTKPVLDLIVIDEKSDNAITSNIDLSIKNLLVSRVKYIENISQLGNLLDSYRVKCVVSSSHNLPSLENILELANESQAHCYLISCHNKQNQSPPPQMNKNHKTCIIESSDDERLSNEIRNIFEISPLYEFDAVAQEIFFRDWKIYIPDKTKTESNYDNIINYFHKNESTQSPPTLVVIEDNLDFLYHILQFLKDDFHVFTTNNAESAFTFIMDNPPLCQGSCRMKVS